MSREQLGWYPCELSKDYLDWVQQQTYAPVIPYCRRDDEDGYMWDSRDPSYQLVQKDDHVYACAGGAQPK